LSKGPLSSQSSLWTCDSMRPIPKRISRREPTWAVPNPKLPW
jgi:hypothetical protein